MDLKYLEFISKMVGYLPQKLKNFCSGPVLTLPLKQGTPQKFNNQSILSFLTCRKKCFSSLSTHLLGLDSKI